MKHFAPTTTLLLLGPGVLASLQNESLSIFPGHEHHGLVKRWFSTQEAHPPLIGGSRGPWPVMCPGTPEPSQSIRYCFQDQRSSDRLGELVNQAVAKGSLALHPKTALKIELDNENSIVCSEQNRADALVFQDITTGNKAEDNRPDCHSRASLGYDYASTNRGRNHMEICAYKPDNERGSRDQAISTITHELGHVIGLAHEHQRGDALTHIHYRCENVPGFREGMQAALADAKHLFDNRYTEELRKQAICYLNKFAEAYLPGAAPYVIDAGQNPKLADNDGNLRTLVYSNQFDFNSMMIYSSQGSSKNQWIIWRRDTDEPIYQGGSRDPAYRRISTGDLARVAQLYPLQSQRFKGGQPWREAENQQSLYRVRIRDELDVVVPPPRRAEEGLGMGDWSGRYGVRDSQ